MASNPERLAWRILVTAFLIFLLLCSTVAYLIQWFVFQSTVPMTVDLRVARGTASLSFPDTHEAIAETIGRPQLELGSGVTTDPNSQATLIFSDARTNERIASVVIFRESGLTIDTASAPRFGLNNTPYSIEIEDVSGRIEILLHDTSAHRTQLEITSGQMHATITENGSYQIEASDQQTRLIVRSGSTTVIDRFTQKELQLETNEQTVIQQESAVLSSSAADETLLDNPLFREDFTSGWLSYNEPSEAEPPGQVYNSTLDGRSVVVIDRSQGHWLNQRLGHMETGLLQRPNLDVSNYNYLELRTTFFVDEQSLERCGEQGSECPLMLHIKFIDTEGNQQEFFHGFYAFDNPNRGYPETCSSCRISHDRISMKSWFTYESGNLLVLFSGVQRPQLLTEVSIYASGHAYKVFVSEVNIIAAP
jgi:hypothetical protein